MNLVWTPESLDDLGEIYSYIGEHDRTAAKRMLERIHTIVELHLPGAPNVGRPGRVAGTRELVVPGTPFIVPYRVTTKTIEILRVYHAARRWPSAF